MRPLNLPWKLAIFVAMLAAVFAIYDNGQRVERLERQVCESLYQANEAISQTEYYSEHPLEREDALERNRGELRRFHCPEGTP